MHLTIYAQDNRFQLAGNKWTNNIQFTENNCVEAKCAC